jgi:MFS transporter, PPP family, 3-phenylpropionic acid transporter
MFSVEKNELMTPEVKTSIFYFTVFMSGGAANAYGGIWFENQGLSADQIGMISSVPLVILLLLNVFVGRLADRASDWKQVIILGSVGAALSPFGLLISNHFMNILLFWSLAVISQSAIVPVVDAAAMRVTVRRGTDFGAIRAWGTVGYVVAIFATGLLVSWLGGNIFVGLFVILGCLRAVASLLLPQFRAPEKVATIHGAATQFSHLMKPWLLVPLVAWAMIFSTHLVLNAFQALIWKQQGFDESTISFLIGLGAISEAAMFFAFKHFGNRFEPRHLMVVSGVVATLRWIAMAYAPNVYFLVPLQLLHSVTYAMGFLGCMRFVTKWTAEDMAAEAQGFAVVVQQVMGIFMFTIFGRLITNFAAQTYFASAAMAALGTLMVLFALKLELPKAPVTS